MSLASILAAHLPSSQPSSFLLLSFLPLFLLNLAHVTIEFWISQACCNLSFSVLPSGSTASGPKPGMLELPYSVPLQETKVNRCSS